MHRQQVHDALREAHEEQLVVDGAGSGGLLSLAEGIVQEHQVEIGRVAQLDSTQLAIPGSADRYGASVWTLATQRRTELLRDLSPGQLHRPLENQLRNF